MKNRIVSMIVRTAVGVAVVSELLSPSKRVLKTR